jgi:hypothetical protein
MDRYEGGFVKEGRMVRGGWRAWLLVLCLLKVVVVKVYGAGFCIY